MEKEFNRIALLAGGYQWSDEYIQVLRRLGFTIQFQEQEAERLICNYEEVVYVACNFLFLYHDVNLFSNLQMVQLLSAGMDRIPVDTLYKRDVKIYSVGSAYAIPMAECVVLGILQIIKKSAQFFVQKQRHEWNKIRDLDELSNKSVLIVGMGNVGREIAKRLHLFVEKIDGVDLYPNQYENIHFVYQMDILDQIIGEYDIIIAALPLTKKTERMFNAKFFTAMKDNAIFVNIARGKLVVQGDMVDALKTKLKGAVLDVYDEEPLPDASELWELDNVILTPHNSFVSVVNNARVNQVLITNVLKAYET